MSVYVAYVLKLYKMYVTAFKHKNNSPLQQKSNNAIPNFLVSHPPRIPSLADSIFLSFTDFGVNKN